MTPEEQKSIQAKRTHMSQIMSAAKRRAETKKIPYDLDLDYAYSIAPNVCPIFKAPLKWGAGTKAIKGSNDWDSPSLDRIIPEKGYTKGNVAWISLRANRIKSDMTEVELYKVADWLHTKRKEVLNGGVLPPAIHDAAFTYVEWPTNTRIDTSASARKRGGY